MWNLYALQSDSVPLPCVDDDRVISRVSSRFHFLSSICGPSTKSQRLQNDRSTELVLAKPSHHLFPLQQREGTDLAAEKHKRLFLLLIQGQLKQAARLKQLAAFADSGLFD